MERKWRFASSGHGSIQGINSSDEESFKKNQFAAFAREILQNSIDVRVSNEKPVRVEMSEFIISPDEIPGVEEYKKQVRNCIEFWNKRGNNLPEYENILKLLDGRTINCLKISDYNTTGLEGVKANVSKFSALVFGNGVSEKSGPVSGGSKGFGKSTAFILSKLKMVFYSTITKEDEKGFIGVTKLVSGYNENKTDTTFGTGYYSNDDENNAIPILLNFSAGERTENGTDIYIIGFQSETDWEYEVIGSLLDSFLAAIYKNDLEICINNRKITSETLGSIIEEDADRNKYFSKNIYSQYLILNKRGEIFTHKIKTDYGVADLYVLLHSEETEQYSTHNCAMIRYPLMKIKDIGTSKTIPTSSICIVGNDKLGEMLRSIENAQHKDWEYRRIPDVDIREEYKQLIKQINKEINDFVSSCIEKTGDTPLDPVGAGEFLPDEMQGDSKTKSKLINKDDEVITVGPKKKVKFSNNYTGYGNQVESIEPDIGDIGDSNGDDVLFPNGKNDIPGKTPHPGEDSGEYEDGEKIVYKKLDLSGVKYTLVTVDKKIGKNRLIFLSPVNIEKCYLELNILDDADSRSKVLIKELFCNGTYIQSDNKYKYGPFQINVCKTIILDFTTDVEGYYSYEVNIYANEK